MEKQQGKIQWIIFPFLAGVFLVVLGIQSSASAIDLSTPESTVMDFCKGAGERVQEYFHEIYEPVDPKIFGYPIWTDCRIVESKKTDRAGLELDDGLVLREEDAEVRTEVTLPTKKFGDIKAHYVYTLRKMENGWKIIAHYRALDEHFKGYD